MYSASQLMKTMNFGKKQLSNKLGIAISMVMAAVLLSGCGVQASEEYASNGNCPQTNLEISSNSVGYQSDIDWSEVRSSYAYSTLGSRNIVSINLANFDMNTNVPYPDVATGESILHVTLSNVTEDVDIQTGEYQAASGNDLRAVVSIDTVDSSVQMAQPVGQIKVTELADTYICGQIDIQDQKTQITGEFTARFVK